MRAWKAGVVVPEGLIAHGRGEAWDYLLGEAPNPPALVAEKAAAAYLLRARRPVLSVNGNVAALAAREIVRLARTVPAAIEVNLFHRTETRVRRISTLLRRAGAQEVLGPRPDARIPGLESKRALVHRKGIFAADVVLVPLEDGDRTEALARMGKIVIAIDLNPLSRTSRAATVPVVDEVSRALAAIAGFVRELRDDSAETSRILREYDKARNLGAIFRYIEWRLRGLQRKRRRTTRMRARGSGTQR